MHHMVVNFARRLTVVGVSSILLPIAHAASSASWVSLNQGVAWTSDARVRFYSRDQGSRLIPLRWIAALQQPDGSPFLAGSLSRYGFLPNENSLPAGLPVGFSLANTSSGEILGVTCAACHTRQINVQSKWYRVDGGPAITDFQGFLVDLDAAVGRVLNAPGAFDAFARSVLGPTPAATDSDSLRKQLDTWYEPFHTIVDLGLPAQPWGPGRLDAVSMIFNRLAGLDIGSAPNHIIKSNIYRADAPVRYPFLWNAYRQDRTQWPGFAANGNSVLGLGRNVGEVTGVFALFHPSAAPGRLLGINFVAENSTNFEGLEELEHLIEQIGPPKFPWPVNAALATQGAAVFAKSCAHNCHEVKVGQIRGLRASWKTPIQNVRTDTREWSILDRKVDPGVLAGASIWGVPALQNPDSPLNVLSLAVLGSIVEHSFPPTLPDPTSLADARLLLPQLKSLDGAFHYESGAPVRGSYESRVLRGIWATAPYLHNGSVPNLAELLKPAAQRVAAFQIGPTYDLDNVGLAVTQSMFPQVLKTTDCTQLDSGNSRCGHEFGTSLSEADKKALLEYLKTL
jgi:hypothetical protein